MDSSKESMRAVNMSVRIFRVTNRQGNANQSSSNLTPVRMAVRKKTGKDSAVLVSSRGGSPGVVVILDEREVGTFASVFRCEDSDSRAGTQELNSRVGFANRSGDLGEVTEASCVHRKTKQSCVSVSSTGLCKPVRAFHVAL